MMVKQLINALIRLPQDVKVSYMYDGIGTINVEHVWISRAGEAVICGEGEPVYDSENRPEAAPTEQDDPDWSPAGQDTF